MFKGGVIAKLEDSVWNCRPDQSSHANSEILVGTCEPSFIELTSIISLSLFV